MRKFARWCTALIGSAAAFAASWWICARLGGLDEGVCHWQLRGSLQLEL